MSIDSFLLHIETTSLMVSVGVSLVFLVAYIYLIRTWRHLVTVAEWIMFSIGVAMSGWAITWTLMYSFYVTKLAFAVPVFGAWMVVGLVLLPLVFGRSAYGWAPYGAILLGAVLLGALAVPELVHKDIILYDGSVIFRPGPLFNEFYRTLGFLLICGFGTYVWRIRRASGAERVYLQALMFGYAVFVSVTLVTSIILPEYGITRYLSVGPIFIPSFLMAIFTVVFVRRSMAVAQEV